MVRVSGRWWHLWVVLGSLGSAEEIMLLRDGSLHPEARLEGSFRSIPPLVQGGPGQGRWVGTLALRHWTNAAMDWRLVARTMDAASAEIIFGNAAEPVTVRVANAQSIERPFPGTGSIVGCRPVWSRVVRDGEWFELRARHQAGRVRTWINGREVADGTVGRRDAACPPVLELRWVGGGDLHIREFGICDLQPDTLDTGAGSAESRSGSDPRIDRYLAMDYPLLNLHVHLKGGLTAAEAVEESLRSGVGFGLAVNVGLGFPTTNDVAAQAWVESLRGWPVFIGLQAEGREWMKLVRPETVVQFDYVLTDAMTITDRLGRRMRLWMASEVIVDDPEEFMDTLVQRTIEILEREPVDIWANPTYLPAVWMGQYDRLWTEDRMRRVIEAAVRNGVAIEINSRLRLPRRPFLRIAKAMGARFSLGTNNSGREIGDLQYALDMIEELGLRPEDFFVPIPGTSRASRLGGWPPRTEPRNQFPGATHGNQI